MATTIYDLAEAAGVSIATVSRALNNHYAVSEATKKRILALAEEMDFHPSARARSFAKRRSGIVLFVTDLYRNVAFENPHMFEIITGISQYLDSKNYSLLIKHISAKDARFAVGAAYSCVFCFIANKLHHQLSIQFMIQAKLMTFHSLL